MLEIIVAIILAPLAVAAVVFTGAVFVGVARYIKDQKK